MNFSTHFIHFSQSYRIEATTVKTGGVSASAGSISLSVTSISQLAHRLTLASLLTLI